MNRTYESVSYAKCNSERLQRAFQAHEVTIVHKPFNSITSPLVRVKDKTEDLKKCGTVSCIHFHRCDTLIMRAKPVG